MALVVPGRLVVDAAPADLPALAWDLNRPRDRHPRPLAGPGEALAAGTGGFDRSYIAQLQRRPQSRPVDLQPRPVEAHLAAARKRIRMRPLLPSLAVPEHPERLRRRPHLGARRAQHQLLGEDGDVA